MLQPEETFVVLWPYLGFGQKLQKFQQQRPYKPMPKQTYILLAEKGAVLCHCSEQSRALTQHRHSPGRARRSTAARRSASARRRAVGPNAAPGLDAAPGPNARRSAGPRQPSSFLRMQLQEIIAVLRGYNRRWTALKRLSTTRLETASQAYTLPADQASVLSCCQAQSSDAAPGHDAASGHHAASGLDATSGLNTDGA